MRLTLTLLLLAACTGGTIKPEDPDIDGDGFTDDDCDDEDAAVFPGATEACNGHDDNCDGHIDEGLDRIWYTDGDGDGYGAGADTTIACEAPAGKIDNQDDCDDTNAAVNPAATETCNGIDDDCDGSSDGSYGTWYDDLDGDGYGAGVGTETCTPAAGQVTDGTDCDDADAAVYPGAVEVCDGDDDDCDGRADVIDIEEWHSDDDGDGYGHMYESEITCAPQEGWVLDGTDCRPGDPEAYPGAPERCNDDDDDCDGENDEDFDIDGDGERSSKCDGEDCDDNDPAVYPDATEVCENGTDDDCDGDDARCGFDGEIDLGGAIKLSAPGANYDAGRLIEVGDLTGDGTDDVLIATMYASGYNGGAFVVPGPVTASAALDSGYELVGSRATYAAGRSTGIGDVDGDGQLDVAIGAPDGTEKEFILFGPITSDVDIIDADVIYSGAYGSEVGHGSDLADIDGDGIDDAIVGAYEDHSGAYEGGIVYVMHGPLAAEEADITDAYDYRLIGDVGYSYAGRYIRAGGDVDGDGVGDILAAAPYATGSAPSSGVGYLVYGGGSSDIDLSTDADGTYIGEGASDYASEELALGDVDGDGLADVLLGAWNSSSAYYAGAAYVIYGPASGEWDLAAADGVIRGTSTSQSFGLGLAAGDADGDGEGDLLVGAYGDSTSYASAGAAYLFFGPVTGTWTTADAGAVLLGESSGDQVGEATAIADVDDDGLMELLVGAPLEASGGPAGGAVYIQHANE